MIYLDEDISLGGDSTPLGTKDNEAKDFTDEEKVTCSTSTDDADSIFDKFLVDDDNNETLSSSYGQIKECVFGIDEAGRGPVCGPLVYGICVCEKRLLNDKEFWKTIGADDSKKLKPQKRQEILERLQLAIKKKLLYLDFEEVSPKKLSYLMLSPIKQSLNMCSYLAAANLVEKACGRLKGVFGKKAKMSMGICDIITPAWQYEEVIRNVAKSLPSDCAIKIEKEADATYQLVGAASIIAKQTRDSKIKPEWGSGYPGTAATKKYIESSYNGLFGFPNNIRWSWATAQVIELERSKREGGIYCRWIRDQEYLQNLAFIAEKKKKNMAMNRDNGDDDTDSIIGTGMEHLGCISYSYELAAQIF